MHHAAALGLCVALCGCSVAVSGGHTTDGGGSASVVTSTTQAHARIGSAKLSGSFGTPAPSAAPGARASFSNGAAGVLILGLVIADLIHYLASPAGERVAPQESISHTCSCYGYQPPVQAAYAATGE